MRVLSEPENRRLGKETAHMAGGQEAQQTIFEREMAFRREQYIRRVMFKNLPRPSLKSRLATSSSLRALARGLASPMGAAA